jgi:DNA-binding MarR family transcriptional regulator
MRSGPHKDECGEIGPACFAYRARMLSRVISAIYDEALAPLGLKGSQLNVLAALSRNGLSTQNNLCTSLKMDKSTLSRNIERMRKRGWLRANRGKDNRTRVVSVTPKGAKLLRDAFPLWRTAQEIAGRRMGVEGVAAFDVLVKKLHTFDGGAHDGSGKSISARDS